MKPMKPKLQKRATSFRLWQRGSRSMLYEVTVLYLALDGSVALAQTKQGKRAHDPIVMQYTGLKDKNGKEIYEGDICKQTFDGVTMIGDVSFSPTSGYGVGLRPLWPHDIEVIGNVYENAEMLAE